MRFKKVLIVGGSSGLGFHLTKLYIKNHYKVTTISRNSNLSQRFILIAFLIQFIIFLVVQGMEIISTRREINEI